MKKKDPLTCLINSCHLVSSTLDLNEVLRGVTKMSKNVLNAEAGSLMLLDEPSKTLKFTVALGKKGNRLKKDFSLKLGQGIAGLVAQRGKPLVVADAKKDIRFYKEPDIATGFKTRSILAVPLKVRDKTIGVLEALNPEGKIGFSDGDIPMFQAFANQVAVAIENTRMHKKILDQLKMEQQLSIAGEIQKHILPHKNLKSSGITIKAEYKAAGEVGGDFFNIIDTGNSIIIAIGDVTGKGVPAALYMVRLVTELRSLARNCPSITEIAYKLNNTLLERQTRGMFATAVILSIDKSSKQASLINAGHPDPMFINGEKVTSLKTQKGFPLGIVENFHYPSVEKIFKKGHSLLLFTDGIIEIRNKRGKQFGTKRLLKETKKIFKSKKKCFLKELFNSIKEFSKGSTQHDDLTSVIIKT